MLNVRVQNVFYQCFFNTEVKNMKNFNASIALNVILFCIILFFPLFLRLRALF